MIPLVLDPVKTGLVTLGELEHRMLQKVTYVELLELILSEWLMDADGLVLLRELILAEGFRIAVFYVNTIVVLWSSGNLSEVVVTSEH